jgi:hypothetical protein
MIAADYFDIQSLLDLCMAYVACRLMASVDKVVLDDEPSEEQQQELERLCRPNTFLFE